MYDIEKIILKKVYDLLDDYDVATVANKVAEAITVSKENERYFDNEHGKVIKRILELRQNGAENSFELRKLHIEAEETDMELLKAQLVTEAYEEALVKLNELKSWND